MSSPITSIRTSPTRRRRKKVAELTSILRAHQSALVSRYAAPDAPIPPEVLVQLEALGYFNDTEVAPESR